MKIWNLGKVPIVDVVDVNSIVLYFWKDEIFA